MGSFQDLAGRKPRQDESKANKVTTPTHPLPHSNRMAPPASRGPTVPQLQVPVVQYDSLIPETEPDALEDEMQFRERHTKSNNDVQWEDRLTCSNEEVNGRLKRKKGHQRVQPQEREVRINVAEGDLSQKRKMNVSGSRRGSQSQPACDFEGDTAEFSTEEDDEDDNSDDGFQDMPSLSQFSFGQKESNIDRFLRGEPDVDDRKQATQTKGKKLQLANRKPISTRTRSAQRGRP